MATLNSIDCSSVLRNVGGVSCGFMPDVIMGVIFIPKGMTFNAAQIADWRNTLVSLANSDNPSQRIFPIGPFTDFTDNSEDTVRETTGYGDELFVREGQYRWQMRLAKANMCLHTALSTFINKEDSFDMLLWDKTSAVIGTTKQDEFGRDVLGGFALASLERPKLTLPTGSTKAQSWIRVTLQDESELNARPGIVIEYDSPFNMTSALKGLIDVKLSDVTPPSAGAGVKHIAAMAGCGAQNLAELFETELADFSLFTATNVATNAPIAITAATVANGVIELALDTLDPNYPSSGTGKIRIGMVAPSVLAAADIETPEGSRYEAIPVMVTAATPTT